MEKNYDVIIAGTGVAGTALAFKLNDAGMKVAITDPERFGGTCAVRGCVPKKILTGMADIIDANNRMRGKGGSDEELRINWRDLVRFKTEVVDSYTLPKEEKFIKSGIDTYHEKARFLDESTMAIGDDRVNAKYMIIATGAEERKLNIPGEEYLSSSEEFMELEELPQRIIFAGGGYISFEFAHIAARAGVETCILHRGERPLKQFDPELVDLLIKASEDAGIEINVLKELRSIEKKNGMLEVTAYDLSEEKEVILACDMIVHGLGRVPMIGDLDTEKGNVAVKDGAIEVNEQMQSTTNPRVYAAGDCIKPGPALTPSANLQANIIASYIIDGDKLTADYSGIASAVFTIPTLASVGILESESTDEHEILFNDMSQWYSARKANIEFAASKIIIEKDSGKIAGAHILGPNAEDAINIFALAIRSGLTAAEVRDAMYAYPSSSYDVRYMFRKK